MNTAELPAIQTLLCHAHVAMASRCLESLRRCHQPAFRLVIHDDGSLTEADREQLAGEQPGTTFVLRPEADERMRETLARHPRCRAYREQSALGLKCMDVPLLAGGPLAYCDTDFFFVRPFTGFHRLLGPAQPLVFMQDLTTAYAVRYWHLLGADKLRLMRRLNAGVMLVDPRVVDLDFMEHVLGRIGPDYMHHLAEQTYWSAQAARVGGCRYVVPAQMGYPPPDTKAARLPLTSQLVAWHLISPLRKWLPRLEEAPLEVVGREVPVDLRTVPARRLGAAYYIGSRLGKQVRYWQGKAL